MIYIEPKTKYRNTFGMKRWRKYRKNYFKESLKDLPISKNYDDSLSNVKNDIIGIECKDWQVKRFTDPTIDYVQLILNDPVIKKNFTKENEMEQKIHQLRILVDKDWPDRNQERTPCSILKCIGFVHEYKKFDEKQIGIQGLAIGVSE